MTIPQAVLDRITDIEGRISYKRMSINKNSAKIAVLDDVVADLSNEIDALQSSLDLVRFVADQYEASASVNPELPQALILEHPEPVFAVNGETTILDVSSPGSVVDRVYAAMGALTVPATATEIALAAGLKHYLSVAPCLGMLRKSGKVETIAGRGWIRTDMPH
jgi:hypothetical protein